jgi:Uncharacterized protein family UPF0029
MLLAASLQVASISIVLFYAANARALLLSSLRTLPSALLGRASAQLQLQRCSMSATTEAAELVTVVGVTGAEETIKKSRFIAHCCTAASVADSKDLMEFLHVEHPKARHICWAWQGLGTECRSNDDGEPGRRATTANRFGNSAALAVSSSSKPST